jgi:fructose-1,6-bisphosphatase/inositol monophosphatase family enzyme
MIQPEIEKVKYYSSEETFANQTDLSQTARDLAIATILGGRRLLAYYQASPEELKAKVKRDGTAVTIADFASERAMTTFLRRKLPYDRFFGEEKGTSGDRTSKTTTYMDPLDGTNPFMHGEPYSTVGAARREGNTTTTGAICLPFSHELIVAQQGKGSWRFPLNENLAINGDAKRLSVSKLGSLAGAVIYVDANLFAANVTQKLQFLAQLRAGLSDKQSLSLRMICSNIGQQARVAMGQGDASLTDCVGGPYDIFAGEIIIQEAGGLFTDLDGQSVTERTQAALGSNGLIHDELLSILQPIYEGYRGFK